MHHSTDLTNRPTRNRIKENLRRMHSISQKVGGNASGAKITISKEGINATHARRPNVLKTTKVNLCTCSCRPRKRMLLRILRISRMGPRSKAKKTMDQLRRSFLLPMSVIATRKTRPIRSPQQRRLCLTRRLNRQVANSSGSRSLARSRRRPELVIGHVQSVRITIMHLEMFATFANVPILDSFNHL